MVTIYGKLKVRISAWRYKPARPRLEITPQDLHYYPDAMRYHVTLSPVFRARESLTATTSPSHALNYAVTKLAAMERNGDYRSDDVIYVWDLGSPSGATMPFAKFRILDGEVRRA